MWTKHLLRVVWLGDQTWQSPCSEYETIMWGFGLAFPPDLTWVAPILQQRQLFFFSSIRGQGRYLGQHEPWFLNQPHLSCGMGSKKEVAPIKPDLCQLVMPATDRRPFNKCAPTIAEHCSSHRVLQPQALRCDPAWQECMTQHMLSCPELEMFIGRAARLTETKEIFCSRLGLAPWLESLVSCGSMGLTPGLPV